MGQSLSCPVRGTRCRENTKAPVALTYLDASLGITLSMYLSILPMGQ